MTGEISSAEIQGLPEPGFFNLDAWNDDDIVLLMRLIPAGPLEFNNLLVRFESDVHDLARRDPERAKKLAQRCATSEEEYDRELALHILPELLDYDYEFTRDTLIHIRTDFSRPAEKDWGVGARRSLGNNQRPAGDVPDRRAERRLRHSDRDSARSPSVVSGTSGGSVPFARG